jgi:nicotinate-nucleotide adenylyltransferase
MNQSIDEPESDRFDGIEKVDEVAKRKRVGVFGGTFDPVHKGHFKVAEAVLAAFAMERVIFVPAYVPPHKRGQALSSAYHRMAMLVLATIDAPQMFVSTVEIDSPTRPYTIETLQRLQLSRPEWRLFFVMGADSFMDITSWYEYQQILSGYDVIVAARPGYSDEKSIAGQLLLLAPELRERVVDLRGGLFPTDRQLMTPHIYLTDYAEVDVSATTLREVAAKGGNIDRLVPPAVAAYILKYGLYHNSECQKS